MKASAAAARTRLPLEPYPGLRPFLDFESALLFGRERQVGEVIERLRQTQFVAVIGGSGSGKSSLILAGVVPELRSFGIPGAGDFWLPMVCTPGTNVSTVAAAAGHYTPISRLAWKFAQLLRSRGTPQADAERLEEIANVFRENAGFERLMEKYIDELDTPVGPDPREARLLFVIDQFEELFHPTNQGLTDCELMVERVIDHFFRPHPRCYVVLTMRSEHLNDCAGFLELPDAINKSSYLVRRLDDEELEAAIVGPAQRFLRLRARADDSSQPLPEEVRFERPVVDRVLRDARSISHDPDHLPLLQHLLARLWQVALEREASTSAVVSSITAADLARATHVAATALPEAANSLRASLQNWAEHAYQQHPPEQRAQLDVLLPKLAFKDPNTGMYTQQRIDVDEGAALLGGGRTRADLQALLAQGFLDSVDYMFWDDENPARVTLKVSHESCIRGWPRFRDLIDREAERFEEYVNVLRKCADWVARGRAGDRLLESGDLRRLDDSNLADRLREPAHRAGWLRLLQLDRDGARLAGFEPELDAYVAASQQRHSSAQQARKRRRVGLALAVLAAALLLPAATFSLLIQGPVAKRVLLLFDAGNRSLNAAQPKAFADAASAQAELNLLLQAAQLIDQAATGEADMLARTSEWLIDQLAFIPQVNRQSVVLDGVRSLVEPPVNGMLRHLLSSALWETAPRGADGASLGRAAVSQRKCSLQPGAGSSDPALVDGQLFSAESTRGDESVRRRLFVTPQGSGTEGSITILVARLDGEDCKTGEMVMSIPNFIDPHLVFDANLRYFLVSQSDEYSESPSVTLHEIEWTRAEDGSRVKTSRDRAVLADKAAVARVKEAAGPTRAGAVDTWRMPGGRAFEVAGKAWRVSSVGAQRLAAKQGEPGLSELAEAAAGSWCSMLGEAKMFDDGQGAFPTRMFAHESRCFEIARGRPPGDAPAVGTDRRTDDVIIAVYDRPNWGDDEAVKLQIGKGNLPAPIASITQFGRIAPSDERWYLGTSGEYAGWLAIWGTDTRGDGRFVGTPWSTCALWRQGIGYQWPPASEAPRRGSCDDR